MTTQMIETRLTDPGAYVYRDREWRRPEDTDAAGTGRSRRP